jgi:hypothetical protein
MYEEYQNLKKDKILYNKIKKILLDIKKLLLVDTNTLDLEIKILHNLKFFMYLPYRILYLKDYE